MNVLDVVVADHNQIDAGKGADAHEGIITNDTIPSLS